MASRKSGPARKGNAPAGGATRAPGDVDLATHPLVDRFNADPDNVEAPPEVAALVGYIGPSRRGDSVRLYQDLTFRNYYEIPRDGILATSPVNPDDENSPTQVQVDPDTKVEVVTVSVQSVEARYLSGSIAGGFLGAAGGGAGGAQAGPVCANITTYMPSCVGQPAPCANITTHMPSCVGGGQQVCIDLFTANPSHCAQPCVATIVTSGVGPTVCQQTTFPDPRVAAAAAVHPTPPQFCITRFTANPTDCAPMCLTVVTANPTDCGGPCLTRVTANPTDCGAQQFAAEAAAGAAFPRPGPYCITLYTANPSNCGPQVCAFTRVNPTNCGQQFCLVTQNNPSNCGPQFCIVTQNNPTGCYQVCRTYGYPTRGPFCDPNSHVPSCWEVTQHYTITGPGTLVQQGFAAAAAGPQPQPFCITLHTAAPSWCDPCRPIANTAATLCTQIVTGPQPGPCITLHTARPTWCDPPCRPVATTAATLCTQHVTIADPGTICPTLYTARPTGPC